MASQEAHLPDGGLGVPAAEAVPRGEPGGGGGVPVGVVVIAGVEPAQDRVGGGAEQRRDRAEGLQGLAAGGAVEAGGGLGVEVCADGPARAERVRRDERAAPRRTLRRGRPGRIRPRLACTSRTTPSPLGAGAAAARPVARRLACRAATAVRLLRPTHAGCLPPPTEYPFDRP